MLTLGLLYCCQQADECWREPATSVFVLLCLCSAAIIHTCMTFCSLCSGTNTTVLHFISLSTILSMHHAWYMLAARCGRCIGAHSHAHHALEIEMWRCCLLGCWVADGWWLMINILASISYMYTDHTHSFLWFGFSEWLAAGVCY